MAPRRITLVIDRDDRPQKTGIERYADELLAHLRTADGELGFECVALWPRLASLPAWRRRLGFLRGFDTAALGIGGDLIHAVMPLPLRSTRPLVATVHDLIPFRYPRAYPVSAPLGLAASLRVLRCHGAYFVTNSQQTTADLRRFAWVSSRRVTTIPLGIGARVDATAGCEDAEADGIEVVRRRHELPETYFLYLGAMNPRKNLLRLLDALAELNSDATDPVTLALAGRTDWGGDAVQARIAELGLESQVAWLGYVDDAELPALMGGATAFVYPSLYEGFGFPILEAMRAGAVVVCSDRGALAETAGPAAIRLDPRSVRSMTEALRHARDLPDVERNRRIARGREWSERFQWSRTAALTADVYKRLLHHAR